MAADIKSCRVLHVITVWLCKELQPGLNDKVYTFSLLINLTDWFDKKKKHILLKKKKKNVQWITQNVSTKNSTTVFGIDINNECEFVKDHVTLKTE